MRFLILLSLFAIQSIYAQETSERTPKGYVRFVALGDPPPFIAERRGDIRVEKAAPPGSQPPKSVAISGTGEEVRTVSMKLCRITPYVEVQNRAAKISLYQGTELRGNPWAKLPAPVVPMTAVFIREPKKNPNQLTWDKVTKRALKDDLRSFPIGTVRFTNMSTKKMAIKIGEDRGFVLKPGEVKVEKFEVGNTQVAVAQPKRGGGWRKVFDNGVELYARNRINAFIYNSDGARAKGKVKVRFLPERYRDPSTIVQPINPTPPPGSTSETPAPRP